MDDNSERGRGEPLTYSALVGNLVSKRRSRKADIVTGANSAHNTREQNVRIRPHRERKAMGTLARRRLESHDGRWLTRPFWAACDRCTTFFIGETSEDQGETAIEEGLDDEADDAKRQYTLTASRQAAKSVLPCLALRQNFCFCCSRSTMSADDYSGEGEKNIFFLDVNELVSSYLSWSFRTSYFKLIINFAVSYFGFILVFAGIYHLVGKQWPMCINSNGLKLGDVTSVFMDSFHLSWTSFSTVGYGIIYPATGASSFEVPNGCVAVGVICSFEAFMGVLFAGFITSVLFGKVLRSQNIAQVYFSDPIVVRFGKKELGRDGKNCPTERGGEAKGMETEKALDEETGRGGGSGREGGELGTIAPDCEEDKIPCPSLEFRLVNRLHDSVAGEIVEAKLNCIAILDPNIAQSLHDSSPAASTDNDHTENITQSSTVAELTNGLFNVLDTISANRSPAFHSANSKQPHMFTKVILDAEEHPFFRRVWFGRHRLDEHSPLLTPHARRKVKLAGGYWPAELNNYQSIKECIHFRQLLVCISGTSNANAASVYAQKVYDRVDVNVGFRFVSMNYRTDQGTLKTDPYLLNAVYQQRGGGGEPMH